MRRLYAIAIEPPGSIQREFVLYRRRLFGSLGETSALAFPEYLFLAFTESAPASSVGTGLNSYWEGQEDSFISTGPHAEAGSLYLAFDPPLAELQARAEELLGSPAESPPIGPGRGLFLLRPERSEAGRAITAAGEATPPLLSFYSAALLLLELELAERELGALTWLELARAYRPRRGYPPESRGFL